MPKVLVDKEKREQAEIKLADWPEEYIRTVDLIDLFEVSRRRINKAALNVGSNSPYEKNSAYLMADEIFGCIDKEEDELDQWLKTQIKAIG